MTRALTTRQAELAGRRALRPIPLVTITTYSNREAETVDTVHRFSDRGVIFAGYEWLPYLVAIDTLRQTMSHVPDSTGQDGAFDRAAGLTLRNAQLEDGTYLSEQLRSENLLRARVEIAQLLIYDDERPMIDLSGLSASESIVWFRGEVRQVERMLNGREFAIRLGSELPNVPYHTVGDGVNIPPRDRGKVIPIVYGSAVRNVPCIGVDVGALSTLSAPVQYSATSFPLTDASDFPTSGSGFVNGEFVSWAGKSGNTLLGVTRGVGATDPEPHSAGSIVVYTPSSVKFAVGQKGCTASTFRVRNMLNGELTEFGASSTRNGDDTAIFGSGNGVTTYAFTGLQAELLKIVKSTLEQQPDFEFTGSDVDVQTIRPLGNHTAYSAGGSYTRQFNINGSSPLIKRDFGSYSSGDNDSGINFLYDASQAALNGRIVNRYRIVARGTFTLPTGVGSAPPTYTVTITAKSSSSSWPGAGGTLTASWVQNVTANAAGTTYDVEIIDSWITPPASTDLADFLGLTVQVQVTYSNAVEYEFEIDPNLTGVEFEIIGSGSVTQTVLGRINSAAGGVTLELYADVDGPDVPSPAGDYIGTALTPIERPADVVRHFLTEHCGLSSSAIDTTAFDDADTDLGEVHLATVLTDYGLELAAMLGAIAFQSRTNIVQAEGASGTVWRMLTASWDGGGSVFEFDATPAELLDWLDVSELGRDAELVANQFRVLSALDRAVQTGDETAYRQSTRANSNAVDSELTRITGAMITASLARYGTRHHPGFFLPDVPDSSHLDRTVAYLITLAMSEASRFEMIGVPWVDAYALERGDIVEFDLHYRSTIKARVLEVAKTWDTQLVDLMLVEVN